ncbi:GNAT family N-acetyltransferase [Cronbergia sp. UHCC 0137]|uniref:GNAT family N-acetyltransferase n=1 Tax=Cronbergia sp. UHCC 0137 TaxID=3110239 RepID=UPI002B21F021|nr:GNAT family N-acetyltransferase [Cronbergia sp. UHCC 0137]MEA5619325.1 GNAT family N-acetyltransferase [Cronbergia sp. UHCC 0137]
MSRELTARFLTESEYEKWTKFVSDSPTGNIYSLPDYLDVLCQITGDSFRVLGVFQGTELVGGIALYETWSPFSLVAVASPRSLLSLHSPILKYYPSQYPSKIRAKYVAILETLINKLLELPYVYLNLSISHLINDLRPFLKVKWQVFPNYSYIINLEDIGKVWQKIEQNLRRLVERGIKNNLKFTHDDDFDSFYKLHSETYQRKGLKLYLSENQYRKYYQLLQEKNLCQLHQVRLSNGQSIGAFLVLTDYNSHSYTVCAGSDDNYLNLGSSPFLRWKSFEKLAELGYQSNDLRGASLSTVNNFKNQLGGELITNWIVIKPPHFSYIIYRKLTFKH